MLFLIRGLIISNQIILLIKQIRNILHSKDINKELSVINITINLKKSNLDQLNLSGKKVSSKELEEALERVQARLAGQSSSEVEIIESILDYLRSDNKSILIYNQNFLNEFLAKKKTIPREYKLLHDFLNILETVNLYLNQKLIIAYFSNQLQQFSEKYMPSKLLKEKILLVKEYGKIFDEIYSKFIDFYALIINGHESIPLSAQFSSLIKFLLILNEIIEGFPPFINNFNWEYFILKKDNKYDSEMILKLYYEWEKEFYDGLTIVLKNNQLILSFPRFRDNIITRLNIDFSKLLHDQSFITENREFIEKYIRD